MNKKVGLLLTRSVLFPSMAFDLLGGMRAGMEDGGITDAEIKTESIGLGADDKMIYTACEQLLINGATVVAGYLNPASAEKLEPLFASANAILIALDAGYHVPTSLTKLPHVFYVSLQGMLCIRAAVAKAIASGKNSFAYTSSFYDSGYRSTFAAHKGIADGAGSVTYNLFTPLKRAELTLQPLTEHLDEVTPDAIFAAFCGDMLEDYFAAAAAGDVFKGRAVYGSSFVGEEQWLAKSTYPGADVQVCVPWSTALVTPANKHFMSVLTRKNTNINIYSLLGWEAGQVAAKALSSADALHDLEGYSFSSPRGEVTLDAATHQCHAPVYDAVVKLNEATGKCLLEVQGESAYTAAQREKLETDINNMSGPMTSWVNAYGCLDS